MNINMDNYYSTRKNIFERIDDASTATKILMSLMMACLTGIMAQLIIPLPWTPVPITAQTFAVLCSGLLLGKKYGCLSQVLYVVLGIAFVPWFELHPTSSEQLGTNMLMHAVSKKWLL